MPHANSTGGDEFASTDEVKVYKDEGDEEQRSSENLNEEKLGLVTETESGKTTEIESRNYSADENSRSDNHTTVKTLDYNLTDHLPFAYPFIPGYPYSNGTSAGKLLPPGLGFYMYGSDQPPPAHMGIPPLHIDPKTGLPRHGVYGLPTPPGTQSLYGPDLAQIQCFDFLARSTAPFRSAYSPSLSRSPLGWLSTPGILPPSHSLHPTITSGSITDLSTESNDRQQSVYNDLDDDKGRRVQKRHIKKPLNAFMIFMKEMRQTVIDECTLKESAAINQILGRRWHALDRSEQAKYYEMARKEKELHLQLYPGWSARDNYATHTKKKKLKRDPKVRDNEQDKDCLLTKKNKSRYGFDQHSDWFKPSRSSDDENDPITIRGQFLDDRQQSVSSTTPDKHINL